MTPAPPRLALSSEEAAQTLGVSRDTFDRYIAPDLRVVRIGRRKLYPFKEIDRWLDRNAAMPLEGQ